MKKIELKHILSNKEVENLSSLIDKNLSVLGSNSITVYPSSNRIYRFNNWIDIGNWENSNRIKLNYSFDESPSLEDFITLQIDLYKSRNEANNASIIFAGKDIIKISKIEIYGYDSEFITKNQTRTNLDYKLEKNESYCEVMETENILLLHGYDERKVLIECLHPYLELTVTMDPKYISTVLNRKEPKINSVVRLKRTIK